SAWPARLPLLWPALEYDHVNTVEIPVYWNQVEAQPGKYDFTVVDMILAEARKHQVHVIPLWFATWKNGSQHFMPDWMKMDTARYAHDVNRNGEAVDSPSPFATASLEADKSAFAVDAAPEGGGPAAHGHYGAGGERAGKLWDGEGLLARRAEVLRRGGSAGDFACDECEGCGECDVAAGVWRGCGRVLQRMGCGKVRWAGGGGGEGCISVADVRQCGSAQPAESWTAERLRERRADGQRAFDMEGGCAVAGPVGAGQLPDRSGGVLKRFGAVPSRGQCVVPAGDGTSGECALLLQGAWAGGHRVFAVGREHGGRVPADGHIQGAV